MNKIIMLLVVLCLSACQTNPEVPPVSKVKIKKELMEKCKAPIPLKASSIQPDKLIALRASEVAAYNSCKQRYYQLQDAVKEIVEVE